MVIFSVFWLSLLWYVDQFIYLMLLVGFKSAYQKRFNQKIYLWKNLAVTIVYFCFEHGPLNRERIFHWIAIFLSLLKLCSYLQIKNKVRGNMGI